MQKHGKTWDKLEEAFQNSLTRLQSASGIRSSTCSIKEPVRKHQSRSLSYQKPSSARASRPMTASTTRYIPIPHPSPFPNLSQRDFDNLFKAKCLDLNISETEDQEKRFSNYCSSHLTSRTFNLSNLGLGLNTANILGQMLSNSLHFSNLLLSKNNIKSEGCASLFKSLKNSLTLSHLDVSSNSINEKGFETSLLHLVQNESISSLDLASKGQVNKNRLGTAGCRSLSKVLIENKVLAILNIAGTGITSEGLDLLVSGIRGNTSLVSLDLENNSIGAKGAEKLVKAVSGGEIKMLNLTCNKLGDEGAAHVAKLLACGFGEFCGLSKLILAENLIGTKGIESLFKSLRNNCLLIYLSLAKNNLSKGLSSEFVEFLYENSSLKSLHLNSCLLVKESLTGLAEGLSRNFGLEELNFSNNFIQNEGCEDLAAGLMKNKVLKKLDLTNNKIRSKGAGLLLKSISGHKTLESLVLKQNLIQDDFGKILNDFLRKKHSITHIDLDFNPISVRIYKEIKDKIKKNKLLKKQLEVPTLKQAISKIYADNSILENIHHKLMSLNSEKTQFQEKVSEKGFKLQHLKELEHQQMMQLFEEHNKLKDLNYNLSQQIDELNNLHHVKFM